MDEVFFALDEGLLFLSSIFFLEGSLSRQSAASIFFPLLLLIKYFHENMANENHFSVVS